MEKEEKIKKVRDKLCSIGLDKKKSNIIALGELTGFINPFNGQKVNYIDKLVDLLTSISLFQKSFVDPTQFYDFQSLIFRDSNFIESLLINNPTSEEVYRLMSNSVDVIKEQSFLDNITINHNIKQRYISEYNHYMSNYCHYKMNYKNKKIHDIFKTSHGTIVLNSSLKSDITYKLSKHIFSILGNNKKGYAVDIIHERKDEIIKDIIEKKKKIYYLIYKLNPRSCILEIGCSFQKIEQIKKFNKDACIIYEFLVDLIEELKVEMKKADVAYITGNNNKSTFHRQMNICDEILSVLVEKLDNPLLHLGYESFQIDFTNEGLYGMMKQEEDLKNKYMQYYLKTQTDSDLKKMNEHRNAHECYQKTICQ